MLSYPTPYYLVSEDKIRRNLSLIKAVSKAANVEIIMAFKANALWKTFNIFREYNVASTASSINEMLLGNEELGKKCHTYCPAYTQSTIDEYIDGSSHISFNSIAQFNQYYPKVELHNKSGKHQVSCGLRINPQCSVIDTDIYNPCSLGSRFGVTSENMPSILPKGIDGFHFHALCESTSYDLEKVLIAIKAKFGNYLPNLKWINMGGGHLMTKEGYDTKHLIKILKEFNSHYPNLSIILEPGSAFTWRTGDLITSVIDVVENNGIKTIIIDASFACHMPDCLEMPYKPIVKEALKEVNIKKPTYRIGGNSCLSGDFIGDWSFEKEVRIGDILTFEDMNHYTTVKTTMFNGISHPSLLLENINHEIKVLREFDYTDYKNRMD